MRTSSPDDINGKHQVAALYSRVAANYGHDGSPFFAHAGRRLVELAGVGPGDRVLDVATGRGAVLFPAAEVIGPAGRAIGIDLAAGMVEQTHDDIARRGLRNVDVLRMDAERLAFQPQSFDRILCSFAIFFFSDVRGALTEFRRVLRLGGTVAFAFSRRSDPRWAWYEELLKEFGALDGMPPMSGNPAIRAEGALVAALRDAGFANAREVVEKTDFYIPDEETWWSSLWTHGSRRPLEHLDSDTLERLRDACFQRLQAIKDPSGLPISETHIYVLASRT
jgi:ubiquinone/menaquinone biosynthesis C-methylase UbiE